MGGSNVPFGSKTDYTEKTAPLSRDIIEWAKQNLTGPPGPAGPKGDTGDTGAVGSAGENAPAVKVRYSADGINFHLVYNAGTDKYIQFSYDDGSTWDDAVIELTGVQGEQGNAAPNVQIEYSSDGLSYQDTQPDPTNYIRFSLDGGSTWQDGIYVRGDQGIQGEQGIQGIQGIQGETGPAGANGTNGTNAYLYIAWADDSDGNGFTLTFDSSKNYRAEIKTTSPITPNVSNFVGLWKYVKGPAGVNGQDVFQYIAYASDISGTGFTLVNSESLDYMAILFSYIEIVTPEVSDFAGLWFKRKGDNGSNASYIELPNAATLSGRCDAIISQPAGWVIDSADQISNPLSTNPSDLIVYHNTDKEVIDVKVKSKTSDRQTLLVGAAAYSTFEDDDTKKYLCIKSFSETETALGIFIMFES